MTDAQIRHAINEAVTFGYAAPNRPTRQRWAAERLER